MAQKSSMGKSIAEEISLKHFNTIGSCREPTAKSTNNMVKYLSSFGHIFLGDKEILLLCITNVCHHPKKFTYFE